MLESVEWLAANHVVMARFSGQIGLADFGAARERFAALVPPDHAFPLYTLYHTSARTGLDWQMTDLYQVHKLGFTHPQQRGLIVVDDHPHPVSSMVGRMVAQVARVSLHIVPTLPAAFARLRQIDPALKLETPAGLRER